MISAAATNVGRPRRGYGGGGYGGGFGLPGGGLGIGTVIVLGLIGWAIGIDPRILIGGAELISGGGSHYEQPYRPSGAAHRRADRPDRPSSSPPCSAIPRIPGPRFFGRGAAIPPAAVAALSRRRAGRLRFRAGGDGAVLLPDRPAHLSRHLVLQRHAGALSRLQRQGLRIRRGLCDRARGRPSRAESARHAAEGAGGAARRRQQGGRQPHPGARRIAGRLLRRRLGATIPISAGNRSSRATSRRRCKPRRRSATTGCSSSRAAPSCRMPSPTALRRSASAGSPTA